MRSIYLNEVHKTLPRVLALFDVDSSSRSFGMGDRYHWGWCLIDFGNGTYQGAAHGLARLLVNGLLPNDFDEAKIRARINAMFNGAETLRRGDGSMEEAFPYESSFCVTALVAFDLLSTIELFGNRLERETRERYLAIIAPMIRHIQTTEERHAFISNHLAVASAALFKWNSLTGEREAEERGLKILDQILDHQSDEGWFLEYEGADPGYQTLCTQFLADIHRLRPDVDLIESLEKSLQFLVHFAHPDGSFGGIYGSRNTRFYYPSGIEALSDEIPIAAALGSYMRKSIENRNVVGLAAMDDSNLIPMFNSYCWAAAVVKENEQLPVLPCQSQISLHKRWPEAGLIIDRNKGHYTVISTHKGGVVYHYLNGIMETLDSGQVIRASNGVIYSTQGHSPDNKVVVEGDKVQITSSFTLATRRSPKPWQFLILRCLSMTVMRVQFLRDWIKKLLVDYLITGNGKSRGINIRTITLGEELCIADEMSRKLSGEKLNQQSDFVAIHMASQGYWQAQDTQ